ncbi:MAG: DUF4440 domain-containing protein [Xanthomonadales bacterium]|nr:DUF4440 domain-containing protein [Xanthomonadales bacterium]
MTARHAPDPAIARSQLRDREPICHRAAYGNSREDLEAIVAGDFMEVGASGRKYSRAFVLDVLERRTGQEPTGSLKVSDFECSQLAPTIFLATYLLDQAGRLSRRATIWEWAAGRWLIRYHQGTPVGPC